MLKNNKGITLSALVITIIVLIIIASVAAISGISATHYIKYQNAKSQFQVIQSKIDSLYGEYSDIKDTTEKTNWKNDTFAGTIKGSNFETELDSSIVNQTLNGLTIDSTNQDNYMYLSTDFIKNSLKVEGISYNFIVNLDEREVRLYGGVEYQNEMYYSAKDFGINIVNYEKITDKISFNTKVEKDGIVIYDIRFPNNMNINEYIIKYKVSEKEYWDMATIDMKKEYTYEKDGKEFVDNNAWKINVSDYGIYNIKIVTASQEVCSDMVEVSITNNNVKPENYGNLVHGYKNIDGDESTDDWQIFYNDVSNIWLISRDYVELDGETQNKINAQKGGSFKYTYWWEEGFTTEGKPNKVIEDLLTNSNNWTYYVDSNFAQKAMGAPTIELFVNSYNEKYPNEENGKLVYTQGQELNEVGIEKDGVTNYSNNVNNEWISNLKTSDNLYIIESNPDYNGEGKAYAYWLSSPCKRYGYENTYTYMYIVSYNGKIFGRNYTNSGTYGFRPVVCLKSDIEINYNSETGIWNLE